MAQSGEPLLLPEYLCPHCRRSVTVIPLAGAAEDRHACAVCRKVVSLQPDGILALVLPRNVELAVTAAAFEVRITNWFATFGIVDRAMCIRVERDSVAWSKTPLLRRVRFSVAWNRLPRNAVRAFDWRMFERGPRGTNQDEGWLDVVFVTHDAAEVESGHRFDSSLDGATVITLLQWAHDHGVRRDNPGGSGYRASATAEPPALRVVTAAGHLVPLR